MITNLTPRQLEGYPFVRNRVLTQKDGSRSGAYLTNKITTKKIAGVNKIKNNLEEYCQLYETDDPQNLYH